jgi:tetratricopeptide (TPR) repeat protein
MIEEPSNPNRPREQSAVPFQQIVSLCENFTTEWQPAQRPDIPSYLDRVDDEAKESLLRNLLEHEVRRRRREGEIPLVEEYVERFPQFQSLVRQVFIESTFSSVNAGGDGDAWATVPPPADPTPNAQSVATVDYKSPAAARLGDYRLIRELGRGGMGVVFEAVHVQRGDRAALKMLPQVDGAQLYRFKREFRSAADISHPNLIGLHSLESDGSQWFFTMDLIDGVDFLDYVRPAGRLDEPRLRSALAQLVMGVMALHSHHIIHRDLKPSNVMVNRAGHVVLLDFGLVVELNHPGVVQSIDRIAGTPAYMAPEQAGGLSVTAAADWYAVGTMLFEALSGKRPFEGSLWDILRDKQNLDPPSLKHDAAMPADLAELCTRLVARDPLQRPDALAIVKGVSAGTLSESPGAASVGGHHLVGRERHLAVLAEAFRSLELKREPQTVFIVGRSGEGKSSLGEQFLAGLRQDRRIAVMAGRCYDRESVPFKALDSLIDALAGYLRALPETDAALLMPDDIAVLARVFPVLERVEVVAKASAGPLATFDEQQIRQRAFGALRSLLGRISRRSPIVWFIDDLQWGDADSAEALFETLRPPEAPQVLVLCTYRSDETEGSAFLTMWKELQRKHGVRLAEREVTLAPLAVDECTQLVVNLLGKDNSVIRGRAAEFARETRGNPFLLIELVGCFDPDTDSFEPLPLHEVLDRKLSRLPDEAGHLLEVIAVSGQALSLEEASLTAGHSAPSVATITRMRNERLVRVVGPDDRPLIDTYHDRVRETVLARMDDGTCKTIHHTMAEVIENGVGGASAQQIAALDVAAHGTNADLKAIPRVYDLAYHYDAAGATRKASIYALLAAEQARRQSALEVAANNFAIARRNADPTNKSAQFRIAEGYGAVLTLLGHYDDAAKQLDGSIDLVDDAEQKASIELLRGEILFKQGLMDRSIACYEQGLRRLGTRVPRTLLGFASGIARQAVVQFMHCRFPGRLHRGQHTGKLDLAIRFFSRLSQPYAFQNSVKPLWSDLSGMNLAELMPPSPQLAFQYACHSCILSMLGWTSRGAVYGERAIAMAQSFDDVWIQGQAFNYRGVILYAAARYEDGLVSLTQAINAFEKAGDLWELNLAHFHRACCNFGLGNLSQAVEEARWVFAASARLGDSRTLCSSYIWARATQGNIPFEELKSCYPCRPDDVMSTVHGVMAEGHWHTFHGRTAEALLAFKRAGELIRRTFCVNSHTILVLPNLTAALRRHADHLQVEDASQSDQLRRRAYRLAKWSVRVARLVPAAYPFALRELAALLAQRGNLEKALRVADKSCAVALAQKAKYEHAQSILVRGQIAQQLKLPEADEQIQSARAALESLEKTIARPTPHSPVPAH